MVALAADQMLARAMATVRDALAESAKTQREIARRMGVTEARLSHIATGQDRNLTLRTIARLAEACDSDFTIELVRR